MLSLWQKRVKCELIKRDMDYEDLAEAVGTKNGYVRQLLCESYADVPMSNPTKKKITEYLRLEVEE